MGLYCRKIALLSLSYLLLVLLPAKAFASFLVQKQTFSIEQFNTYNGKVIPNMTLGWEAYGTLNQDKSNAILITHYFTGNSHAAGKYTEDDAQSGYWDAIIGPGKAIDTDKYYVLSMDTPVNANAFDDNVVTTGPASINQATGKPWGLDFPVLTIRDFVNSQKALLDAMGIKKLHAVIGPSMGSMQAIDWAAAYPGRVARMVSVIGVAEADAWLVAGLQKWADPILQDQMWDQGNYYESGAPLTGLSRSLAIITQEAMHPRSFNRLNPEHSPMEKAPLQDIKANFSVVNWLQKAAMARAAKMDANHILYLVRACQLFMAGHGDNLQEGLSRIQAKSLFLPATGDLLLFPEMAKLAHKQLKTKGKSSQYQEISGDWGHLDGIYSIQSQAQTLKHFIEN